MGLGFWIEGRPKAWERPRKRGRSRSNPSGKGFYNTPEMTAYAERVQAHFIEAKALNPGFTMLAGPVMLTISAFFHVKGASTGWYTGDPDLSNLEKLIEDALEGLAYVNDNQIVAHGSEHGKRITSASHEEGVHVDVRSLEQWARAAPKPGGGVSNGEP